VADIPIVIVTRDRVEPLRHLVDWLDAANHRRVHILDNDSAYPPLLTYFDRLPEWVSVHRLSRNFGAFAPWTTGFIADHFPNQPFVVTDPDVVPDETCPLDLVDHLFDILTAYPNRIKVGVGLRIDDIPPTFAHAEDVRIFESVHWRQEIAPGLYEADVDTTFALYRAAILEFAQGPALRTGAPYLARHLGWYLHSDNLSAEDVFYSERANANWATWNGGSQRPRWLREADYVRKQEGRGLRSKVFVFVAACRTHMHYPRSFWEWQVKRRMARFRG
jgi:hypothetical protein